MIFILFALFVVVGAIIGLGISFSTPAYKGPPSDNFQDGKFFTPGGAKAKSVTDLVKWLVSREKGSWHLSSNPSNPLPDRRPGSHRVTFINHSTFLIEGENICLITDPVFSDRASPLSWAGPKRMRQPGLAFNGLPKVDMVLLSHNHYDHLDIVSCLALKQQFDPLFIVPLGVKEYLSKEGITQIYELDWQQFYAMPEIQITSVPAQHFSGRGLLDRDRSLWCGYIIEYPAKKFYFAGDTGYHPTLFKEIGSTHGPFDLSLIPIGAHKPQWFMSPVHCSPAEAVLIHQETRSSLSIGMHFGTFPLADEGQDEPVSELKTALHVSGIDPAAFICLQEGGSLYID